MNEVNYWSFPHCISSLPTFPEAYLLQNLHFINNKSTSDRQSSWQIRDQTKFLWIEVSLRSRICVWHLVITNHYISPVLGRWAIITQQHTIPPLVHRTRFPLNGPHCRSRLYLTVTTYKLAYDIISPHFRLTYTHNNDEQNEVSCQYTCL